MSIVALFITAASPAEAKKISDALLKERLVACVNALPGVASRYWWKGKIESGKEILLIAKTTSVRLPNVVKRVKELHSYDVPEILALPATGGNAEYLEWVRESVQ